MVFSKIKSIVNKHLIFMTDLRKLSTFSTNKQTNKTKKLVCVYLPTEFLCIAILLIVPVLVQGLLNWV